MRKVTFYFRQPLEQSPQHIQKMHELKENVLDFNRDPALILANGVNPTCGIQDAYSHLSPMIDTDVYMKWLLRQVREAGCEIIQQKLTGVLREQEKALKRQFRADVIVNCAGLGSAELAGEAMYPLRGALVRVRNDGKRFPRITQAHCVAHEGSDGEPGFIFIVPRGTDMLILGGLAEPDQWNLDIGLHNYEPIQTMYRRCVNFLPVLENAEIDATEPVRVGLRPFRKDNVRLDQESGSDIIHNFGHGGAGVTFSWGCALEVAEMARLAFAGQVALTGCTR
jgi:D-amino-acid oxidase